MLSALNTPGAGVVSYHNKNPDATLWIGNIDQQATEELIWELMCQAGPIISIIMPRDRVTTNHEGYAFIEFETVQDADYALRIFTNVRLFGRLLRMNKSLKDDKEALEQQEWLVKIFVGGLDRSVDEVVLSEIFGSFGAILQARIARDPETGDHKGFGFVIFDSFEAGDKAIENMNGQLIQNRAVHVCYAFKKDSKTETHGTQAERLLAAKVRRDHITSSEDVSLSQMRHIGLNSTSGTQNLLSNTLSRTPGADSAMLVDQSTASLTFSGEGLALPPGLTPSVMGEEERDSTSGAPTGLVPTPIADPTTSTSIASTGGFILPPGLNPVSQQRTSNTRNGQQPQGNSTQRQGQGFLPPPPPPPGPPIGFASMGMGVDMNMGMGMMNMNMGGMGIAMSGNMGMSGMPHLPPPPPMFMDPQMSGMGMPMPPPPPQMDYGMNNTGHPSHNQGQRYSTGRG